MLEFCADAPSLGQYKTCLLIYDKAYWVGMNEGALYGALGVITIALFISWIKETF